MLTEGKTPLFDVNQYLRDGVVENAKEALMKCFCSELSYLFADGHARDSIFKIFSLIASETTLFSVHRGPRRAVAGASNWQHPTYAISFNTVLGRHVCDFRPRIVRGEYFKMTLAMPDHDDVEELLHGLTWKRRSRDVAVKIPPRLTQTEYDRLSTSIVRRIGLLLSRTSNSSSTGLH